jgi:hypothetical protein
MFSEYEKLNEEVAKRALEEKAKKNFAHPHNNHHHHHTSSSSTSSSKKEPLSKEEALKRFREKTKKERDFDEFEAKIKHQLASEQAGGNNGISRTDAMRFGRGNSANYRGWKIFGMAQSIFAGSLAFLGFALWYQSNMWQREEDMLVCVNCARQKEIAEEIYFGKPAKKDLTEQKSGRMMP